MTKNTGGPAFPHPGMANPNYPQDDSGMTLRDYFAAKAMQGLASKQGAPDYGFESMAAYKYADAMLKAR